MKQYSDTTRAMIDRLLAIEQPRFWQRGARSASAQKAAAIAQIKAAGEPMALPHLRVFLLDSSEDVCCAAAGAIHALVQMLRPQDYAWLDVHMRASWLVAYSWHQSMKPGLVDDLVRFHDARISVLGIASCHGCGFVREKAVAKLAANSTDGSELPFLLIRCNDWVQEVRELSNRFTRERIRADYAEHFVRNIALVKRLGESGRTDHSKLLHEVRQLLTSEQASPLLRKGIRSADQHIRRECFKLAELAGHEPIDDLLGSALESHDGVLRLAAARKGVQQLDGEKLRTILGALASDRFMPVRREALTALVKRLPEQADQELRRSLLDPSGSIRELARFYIRRREPTFDFLDRYVRSIESESGKRLAAAVAGVGETGQAAHADILLRFFPHERSSVRRAALKAVARLALDKNTAVILWAIGNESPSFSRAATFIVARHLHTLNIDALEETVDSDSRLHVHKNIVWLLARITNWDVIPGILERCRHDSDDLSVYAREQLRIWLRRSFIPRGSADQLSRAAKSLELAKHALPAELIDSLTFKLKIAQTT